MAYESIEARLGTAESPSTPESVLEAFAMDDVEGVRSSFATNPSMPARVIEALAKDKDDWVRNRVAENLSTPEFLSASIREALAQNASSETLRWAIAENSSTPLSALEKLAKDESFTVRGASPRTPPRPRACLRFSRGTSVNGGDKMFGDEYVRDR
jgi:7-keto-8-aminopelargonate synthetase-like enzyme